MTLQVTVHSQNFEPSQGLRDHVSKKVSHLDRYLDVLESARVELRYVESARSSKDRHVAQMTVSGKGVLLRAEERSQDMMASVDAVLEKIQRQIDRYKGRRSSARRDGRSAAQASSRSGAGGEDDSEVSAQVVRRKSLSLTPMDEGEAIQQMGQLGQESFFVFLDAVTHHVHILYRRRDGTLGLLVTDLA